MAACQSCMRGWAGASHRCGMRREGRGANAVGTPLPAPQFVRNFLINVATMARQDDDLLPGDPSGRAVGTERCPSVRDGPGDLDLVFFFPSFLIEGLGVSDTPLLPPPTCLICSEPGWSEWRYSSLSIEQCIVASGGRGDVAASRDVWEQEWPGGEFVG